MNECTIRLTRRQVLIGGAAGTLALSLAQLAPRASTASATETGAEPAAAAPLDYRSWEDVYRRAWSWDRVVRGTHLRANCFSACAFDLYVKDGVVWREEQADVYARQAAGLPDYAPRGCQKGNCYSSLALAPGRLTYPLERVGERGSGRWRRISWDDALTRIADAVIDAAQDRGIETVVYDNGTSNVDWGPSTVGEMRLFALLGATMLDGFAGTGDLAMGAIQTWGTSFVDGSSDDWCRADTLIFWHCNPVATRIPDAHFATEARYRGTTVVTITPDFSPSAIHASLWLNPPPGTDAALALGLVRALLERGAVDAAYVREQTDLPFLVRDDTGRFLRQSDMITDGRDDIFYVFDEHAQEIVEAPGTPGKWSDSLALDKIVPALAGRFEAHAKRGPVSVRPVMERLRERVAPYTPAYVQQVTGIAPRTQERLATLLEQSPRTLIYATWGSCKSHHADLLQRSLILLSALRGQHGRTGSGVRFAAWIPFEGADEFLGAQPSWVQRQMLKVYTPPPRMMESAIAAASRTRLTWTPSHLFLRVHAGIDAAQDRSPTDAALPRAAADYFRDALKQDWLPVRPAADRPPRVLITSGVNPLRRWPVPQVVERVLWPKLKLIVAVDTRLSTTGMKADLLLPAAGYYEKRGIKYAVALAPYVVIGDQAVPPLGESKPEWEIMARLAQHIQERAVARGVQGDLATIFDRFTEHGRYGPQDDVAVLDRILRGSSPTRGMDWRAAQQAGAIQARSIARWGTTNGIGSAVESQGSLSPSRIHVEDKHAWPTLTGRQQFYLDHPWFVEADEVLPCWKSLPGAGGAYPIRLTGGHTRWSIHAIWRAEPTLLRLQRGEPSMWMAVEDARARGIRDHEMVVVRNNDGVFRVRARVAASVAPGEAILYHAWEPLQFPDWRGNMEVVASPFKPTHLVGDYGHLRYRVFASGPVHAPRGVAVEIERDRSWS
ncbi:MAG TPA: molybdopterin-dependent oxidoreductase [Candidatus Binatia bacterium]|nr:molybdopterin-dependent oxidoreductase [Candidatus Binatia bacterium]